MRETLAITRFSLIAAVFVTGAAAVALDACKGGGGEGGAPNVDTGSGIVPECVKSPVATPFPSGSCNAPKPPTADSFDEAMTIAGLDRCTVGLDPKLVPNSAWDLHDVRRLPDFEPLLIYPLRLPSFGRETAKWLDDAVGSPNPVSRAIAAAALRRGAPVVGCPDPAWFALDPADAQPLATAILEVADRAGEPLDAAAVRSAIFPLPPELQRALAPIVRALGATSAEVVEARGNPDARQLNLLNAWSSWIIGTRQINFTPEFLTALDGVDVARMTEAATKLATTIEAAKLSRFAGLDVPSVEIDTPLGAIVVHGRESDEYAPGSLAEFAALVLDTGGNDVYRVPVGAGTTKRAVSVCIDLGGKDAYGYVEKKAPGDDVGVRLPSDGAGRSGATITLSRVGRQGSGVLGVGMLFDFGTDDDTYRSLAVSQGAGILGVGVLYDEGGNDDYKMEVLGQGAAGFGIGLLLDRAGNDKYSGYSLLQGFGNTQGVGAALDLAGNDKWFVDPGDPAIGGDPLYPSPQLPGKGNTSMSQGCGEGRRWDTNPPAYRSVDFQFIGGLGILRDASGDDTYTASVFAQGCGFLGFGMLLEGGGNDTYEGLWYVQGATAHMALALFLDHAGNDRYDPTFPIAATSIGVGHDFSSTVHLDEGGDDVYLGPNLTLGSGYSNGFGLMVNIGGTDVFKAKSDFALGGALAGEVFAGGTGRGRMPTYGVFVKAGGTAKYYIAEVEKTERPGGNWKYAPETLGDAGVDAARSVGIDRPAGTASLP